MDKKTNSLSNKNYIDLNDISPRGRKKTLLKKEYELTLKHDRTSLKSKIQILSNDPNNASIRLEISNIFHVHKGTRLSCNYPLVTKVSEAAHSLIKSKQACTESDISELDQHIGALTLIVDKKIYGDGGNAGEILLKALNIQ